MKMRKTTNGERHRHEVPHVAERPAGRGQALGIAELQHQDAERESGHHLTHRLGQDAQALVLALKDFESVVDHPHHRERGGQPQDEQTGGGEPPATHGDLADDAGDDVAEPHRGQNRQPPMLGVPRLLMWDCGPSGRISDRSRGDE